VKPAPLNKMRRDTVFKALHQQLAPPNFYALDGDLTLIEKIPPATVYIVAHLEFKMGTENISFTQAVCFNQLVSAPLPWRIPVYIIRARKPFEMPTPDATELSKDYCEYALENHRFDIAEYLYADWKPEPPRVSFATIAENIGWRELIKWEQQLREARRAELAPYIQAGWQVRNITPALITHTPNKQVKTKTPTNNSTLTLPL
jgi:hypothetical protein